jgi:hypothetical protein
MYYGHEKQGYHLDEIYTFLATNGDEYLRSDPDVLNRWLSNADIRSSVELSDSDRFDFSTAWRVASTNVANPPLYYFTLFAFRSAFSGAFAKWVPISLNLIFCFGAIILLFFLSLLLFKRRIWAFSVCFLYAISAGALNMELYIRCYTMVIFFVVALLYLLTKNILVGVSIRRHILIVVTIIFGVMSQMYFVVFLFAISICYCLLQLVTSNGYRQKLRNTLHYVASLAIAAIGVYLLMPDAIQNILHGSRYEQAVSGLDDLAGVGFFGNFINRIMVICNNAFGNVFLWPLIVTAIFFSIFVVIYVFRGFGKRSAIGIYLRSIDDDHDLICVCRIIAMTFIVTVFYTIVITAIAPYSGIRYFSPMVALIILSCVGIAKIMYTLFRGSQYANYILPFLVSIFVIGILSSFYFIPVNLENQYPNQARTRDMLSQYETAPIVFVNGDKRSTGIHLNMQNMTYFSQIYITQLSELTLERLDDILTIVNNGNAETMLLASNVPEFEQYIQVFIDESNYENYDLIDTFHGYTYYVLT